MRGRIDAGRRERRNAAVDRSQTAAEAGHDKLASQLARGKDVVRDFSDTTKDVIETAADVTTNAAEEILDKSKALAFQDW
jgi:hypothetical protein